MTRSLFGFVIVGAALLGGAIASGGDAKDEAIKKDRKQIEGTWRVVAVEVNGNKAMEEDAKKLAVANGDEHMEPPLRGKGNQQRDQHLRPHKETQDPRLHANRR